MNIEWEMAEQFRGIPKEKELLLPKVNRKRCLTSTTDAVITTITNIINIYFSVYSCTVKEVGSVIERRWNRSINNL